MRLLAIVILPLAVTSFGLPGAVACFGADGSFAVEAGDEAGCLCQPGNYKTGKPIHQTNVSPGTDGGADCVDVPFFTDWQATVATFKQAHYPKKSVPRPVAPAALGHRKPAVPVWRIVSLRNIQSPPPLFRLALRTIVLLT